MLEAIALRLEFHRYCIRLEAIAIRLEAIAHRLIAERFVAGLSATTLVTAPREAVAYGLCWLAQVREA